MTHRENVPSEILVWVLAVLREGGDAMYSLNSTSSNPGLSLGVFNLSGSAFSLMTCLASRFGVPRTQKEKHAQAYRPADKGSLTVTKGY